MHNSQQKIQPATKNRRLWIAVVIVLFAALAFGQTSNNSPVVPGFVNFSGIVSDIGGKPLSGIHGVTFSLYKDTHGGAPLWMETQNVQAEKSGHYTVMLGASKSSGLPSDVFVSGEARWLGVQIEGQAELPRVLLLSVPYALKAGDAQTVGGLPASAFVLAAPSGSNAPTMLSPANGDAAAPPPATVTGSGTADFLPLWTGTSTIGNSVLFQSGTGSTAKLGINTTTPATTLDVKGGGTVRGTLQLPSISTATATAGANSNAFDLSASSFSSSSKKAIGELFQWQAEPTGNNTANPSGTLNLLFGSGGNKPAETGLKINNKGVFTFASGQTFPGTGTITGVTAGTDLTGGGNGGNVTLSLNTSETDARYAQLAVSNSFNGSETVSGNVAAGGLVSGNQGSFGTTGANAVVGISNGAGFSAVGGINENTTSLSYGTSGQTLSPTGAGVIGFDNFMSGVFQGLSGQQAFGIIGDAADNGLTALVPVGVWGSADSGFGVLGENQSSVAPAGAFLNVANTSGVLAFEAGSNLGLCTIDTNGNLSCTGSLTTAVAVQGGARKVALYGVQSTENWLEDFGSGHLSAGSTSVALDRDFADSISGHASYHVFLTPKGDCKGLYIAEQSATSFVVRELGSGSSSIAFDYRIVGKRRGYENLRMADITANQARVAESTRQLTARKNKNGSSLKPIAQWSAH